MKKRMSKIKSPKNPPRITVELADVAFRVNAARAVRRLGYMGLSDFIREKLKQAVEQIERSSRSAL
jgi:hypothetical protein